MFLLLALALDPAPEVTLLARTAGHLMVIHPAALWGTPAADPLRRQFDAVRFAEAYNHARAAAWRWWDALTLGSSPTARFTAMKRHADRHVGELHPDFPAADMLHAIGKLCGQDSPADIVRLTFIGGGGQAITCRRPINRTRLVHEFAERPGRRADDGATLPERTLAGHPYYRNDEMWLGLLFLNGGRTVVIGQPHTLEPAALAAPAAGPLQFAVEQVRAGRAVVAASVGSDAASLTPAGYRGLCVAADLGDRVTLDAWLLGGPAVADRPAAVADLVGRARTFFAPLPGPNGRWLRAMLAGLDARTPLPGLRPGFRLTFDRPAELPEPFAVYAGDPADQLPYLQDKPVTDQPNLRAVTKGLLAYAEAHGRFPPAASRAADGTPLLSWRVAILPHLGAEAAELHAEFKQGEPWDSPHNLPLAARMPAVFRSLANDPLRPLTPFQVFVGPGTAFDNPAGVPLADFPDGLTDTALVAESGRPVPWTKPHDLAVTADQHVGSELPSGFIDTTVWLGFGDGGVEYATALMQGRLIGEAGTPAQAALRAVLTRNGKEKLGRRDLLKETASVRRVLAPAVVPTGGVPN